MRETRHGLDMVARLVAGLPRPCVWLEGWNEPLIGGIGRVKGLIEIAGGEAVFPDLRHCRAARDRIVAPEAVAAAAPDAILASWCGKKVVPSRIAERPVGAPPPRSRDRRIVEIKSPLIPQPGPAALTDALRAPSPRFTRTRCLTCLDVARCRRGANRPAAGSLARASDGR